MADREKKGKTKVQKFEYFDNEKSFLDEIKNIFRVMIHEILEGLE